MTLTVITPPNGEALSLDAAKDYLRIGTDGEDALVKALIAAARARLSDVAGPGIVRRLEPGPVEQALTMRTGAACLGAWRT